MLEIVAAFDLPPSVEHWRLELSARCAKAATENYANLLIHGDEVIAAVNRFIEALRRLRSSH